MEESYAHTPSVTAVKHYTDTDTVSFDVLVLLHIPCRELVKPLSLCFSKKIILILRRNFE